jgi:hypothetical protein
MTEQSTFKVLLTIDDGLAVDARFEYNAADLPAEGDIISVEPRSTPGQGKRRARVVSVDPDRTHPIHADEL